MFNEEFVSRKRLLILTQWFEPEPTTKGLYFAKELKKKGFDIEILTGFPNYPKGKIYDGYKLRLFQREVIEGININRVFLYPSHNNNSIQRSINYISFSISSVILGLLKLRKPDIIYAYHPPITVGIAAVILKYIFNIPLVYDIQDIWPDSLKATGMIKNKTLFDFIDFICNLIYKSSDKLVVLSPGFKNLLIKRGVNNKKIKIIYNWSNIKRRFGDLKKPENFKKKRFNIVFAGNIGKAQSLDAIIKAAEILHKNNSKVIFQIIGDGIDLERLKSYAKDRRITNINFIPRVSQNEISIYLENANAFIVHLKNDALFKITIPSKTQAYMAFGKPIIMAVKGDAAKLIKKSKCGLICEPENYKQIAKTIQKLMSLEQSKLEIMGKNALEYYKKELSIEKGIQNFSNIFYSLL